MTEDEALWELAKKQVSEQRKPQQEQMPIRAGARRYSHEEWALFLGAFAKGLALPKHSDLSPRPAFLIYPAREERGYTLAEKILDTRLNHRLYEIHWTELQLASTSEDASIQTAKLKDESLKKIWASAEQAHYNLFLLISIKPERGEELRGTKLNACVDLWCELLNAMRAYHSHRHLGGKLQVNFVVLVADTLQIYNELNDVPTENLAAAWQDSALQNKWLTAGTDWLAEAMPQFERLRKVADHNFIALDLQFKRWNALIAEATQHYDLLDLRQHLETLSSDGQRLLNASHAKWLPHQEEFTRAVNYKAHRHCDRFSENAKRDIAQQENAAYAALKLQYEQDNPKVRDKITKAMQAVAIPSIKKQKVLLGHSAAYSSEGSLLEEILELTGEAEEQPSTAACLIGVPPGLNTGFERRPEPMGTLRNYFNAAPPGKVMICHGDSAVGKTSLVIQFARNYSGNYDSVIWWDHGTQATFNLRMIEHLANSVAPIAHVQQRSWINKKLRERYAKILFIFDNVVDNHEFYAIQKITAGLCCDVLVTSHQRCPDGHGFDKLRHLQISCFSLAQASELLIKKVGGTEHAVFDALAEFAAKVPLWLKIMAATIAYRFQRDPQRYHTALSRALPTKSDKAKDTGHATDKIQLAIYQLSLSGLVLEGIDATESMKLATELLLFCSYLSTASIAKTLLYDWFKQKMIPSLTKSQPLLDEATLFAALLDAMHSAELLHCDTESVRIHADLQAIIRDAAFAKHKKPKEKREAQKMYLATVAKYLLGASKDLRSAGVNAPKADVYFPQIAAVIKHLYDRAHDLSDNELQLFKRICSYAGDRCQEWGEFTLQRYYFSLLYAVLEKKSTQPESKISLEMLEALIKKNDALIALGDFNAAEKNLRETILPGLETLFKTTASHDKYTQRVFFVEIACCRRRWGHVLFLLHKTDEAINALTLAKKSFALLPQKSREQDKEYACTLVRLADVYKQKNAYADALPLYQEAYQIQTKHGAAFDATAVTTLIGMGNLHSLLGNHTEANTKLELAKELVAKRFGKQHVHYATVLQNLGDNALRTGQHQHACDLLNEALVIFLDNYDEQTLYVAVCRCNLATVHEQLGNYTHAKNLIESAITTYRALYPAEDEQLIALIQQHDWINARLAEQGTREQRSIALLSRSPLSHFQPAPTIPAVLPNIQKQDDNFLPGFKPGFLLS